jgi:hypothetical protein
MVDARDRWVQVMERELPPIRDELVRALGLNSADTRNRRGDCDRVRPGVLRRVARRRRRAHPAQAIEAGVDLKLNWLPPEDQ